jgi:hypothetical protein
MKTLEVECIVMKGLHPRQNLVVPNVSWGMGTLHECDILYLSKKGYATEVEIKVSKADLLNDAKKKHHHSHYLISRLFFAVPEELKDVALQNIPERAGLIVVGEREYSCGYNNTLKGSTKYMKEVRGAKRNPNAVLWDESMRYQLARLGTLRILGLKEKILRLSK